LLVTEHDCHVYMGSRSVEKGTKAIEALTAEEPRCKGRVELIKLDVSDPKSIVEAADNVKGRLGGKKLYGLVNNAGVLYTAAKISKEAMIQTNVYGVKQMTEAFATLLDPVNGRIVNMGSHSAP